MIVTLTANPSLDRAVSLPGPLVPGGVHRISRDVTQPGGKGINVALGVARAGVETRAIFPAPAADPLLRLLDDAGLAYVATPASSKVRTNLTVLGDDITTKINEPGGELSPEEVAELEHELLATATTGATGAATVMLSGSLAPGIPTDEYATLVRKLHEHGIWVGVDTSDAPLAALAARFTDSAPDFLKPNAEELGQLTGRDRHELEEAAARGDFAPLREAVRALREAGVAEVLVTLGGSGAVLATPEGMWFAPSPAVPVVSTVGAGDSATAGYLIAREAGLSAPERLAYAVAYGAVAVSLPGTTIPRPEQVHPAPRAVKAL
ncbi:1-phosphofructokinase family hexose kinase [Arcanobacterium haemolyticum]|nr:1-phosphofructokinase family hexose kinase [Arcanobacterium haemolyticum]